MKEGVGVPASKAQQKAVAKYMSQNYDEIKVRVPKGRKAAVEARAKGKGKSVNGLVNGLLRAEIGLTESEWNERTE